MITGGNWSCTHPETSQNTYVIAGTGEIARKLNGFRNTAYGIKCLNEHEYYLHENSRSGSYGDHVQAFLYKLENCQVISARTD